MNIAYITAIFSVLVLLVFAVLSFLRADNLKFQVIYIAVATFCSGILASIILVNYDTKSAVIWPVLFLVHVMSKVREVMKNLD
jgi:hypothetical protein